VKKMRKTSLISILLVLLLLVASACSNKEKASTSDDGAQKEDEKNPITLRIAHVTADGSHFDFAAEKFKEIVEADSGGEITVEVYPNGQLGQEREVLENLQNGAIEMALTGHDPLATFDPVVSALGMPYIFNDVDHAFRVVDGEFGQLVKDSLLTKNLRLLEFGENGFRVVTNSKRPIEKPEDYKGLKIRSPQAPVNLAITNTLGGTATPTPFGETYTALQQGVIDGQENALPQIYDSKYSEVQKYLSITNHLYGFTTLLIGEPTFSKLTESQQELVLEAGKEAMRAQREYSRNLSENELIGKLEEQGMIINYPDLAPFKEATKDVYKEFLKDFGQEAYDMIVNTQ
jgi:TRAP-type transport system periplasmic protein